MNEKELAEAAASYLARCCEGVAPPSGQKVALFPLSTFKMLINTDCY